MCHAMEKALYVFKSFLLWLLSVLQCVCYQRNACKKSHSVLFKVPLMHQKVSLCGVILDASVSVKKDGSSSSCWLVIESERIFNSGTMSPISFFPVSEWASEWGKWASEWVSERVRVRACTPAHGKFAMYPCVMQIGHNYWWSMHSVIAEISPLGASNSTSQSSPLKLWVRTFQISDLHSLLLHLWEAKALM